MKKVEEIFYEKTIGIPPIKLYSKDRKKWFDNLNDLRANYDSEYKKKLFKVREKIRSNNK